MMKYLINYIWLWFSKILLEEFLENNGNIKIEYYQIFNIMFKNKIVHLMINILMKIA